MSTLILKADYAASTRKGKHGEDTRAHPKPCFLLPQYSLLTEHELFLLSRLLYKPPKAA